MPAPLPLAADDASVVEDYLAAMRAAGRKTGRSTTQAAHTCQAKIGRAGGWGGLTAEQQLDAVAKARSFTSWLMVTGRITVDAELLSRTDLRPGLPARRFCAAGLPLVHRKHVPGSAFPAGTPRRSGTSWRRSPRSPARHRARSPTNISTPPASR